MKILVCGGRDYRDVDTVNAVLNAHNPSFVIQGGANGADDLAFGWAWIRGVPCATIEANWNYYGKAAGAIRNEWMLRLKPDKVIAFPGGRGTANMIKLAEEAGIEVLKVE
jgi:hypothetical protein